MYLKIIRFITNYNVIITTDLIWKVERKIKLVLNKMMHADF